MPKKKPLDPEPRLPGFFEDYGGYAIKPVEKPAASSKPAASGKKTATASKKPAVKSNGKKK